AQRPSAHRQTGAHEPPQALRLSEELESLLEVAPGQPMRLRTVVEHLHFRGLPALIVLLCIPFLFPVSIPGLSIPFGVAIALCGLRLGLGHNFWMPDFLLRREIPYDLLKKLVGSAAAFYRKVEKLVRPRMHFLRRWPGMINLMGFMIMIGGILLSLPIPPPFPLTNTIPGLAIIFMALGIMERDGVCTLIGYTLAVIGALYVGLIFFLGAAGVQKVYEWCTGP
ncbi:MAG: exopolysaccharide biosynthesis protein, partial [Chthoniobacterales bacterium]